MTLKFLVDQNLSRKTVEYLISLKINAIDLRNVGLFGKSDSDIYEYALLNDCIIITYDHEFAYTYLNRKDLNGLIFLRVHPQTFENLHPILKDFFERVKEENIKNSIIVVENDRFRIRRVK